MEPTTILADEQRSFLAAARTATLATIAPDGRPAARARSASSLVDAARTPVIYTPLDDKPKQVGDPRDLARVRDLLVRPDVSLLVDRWSEDWSQLGWLRLLGRASLLEPDDAPDEHAAAVGSASAPGTRSTPTIASRTGRSSGSRSSRRGAGAASASGQGGTRSAWKSARSSIAIRVQPGQTGSAMIATKADRAAGGADATVRLPSPRVVSGPDSSGRDPAAPATAAPATGRPGNGRPRLPPSSLAYFQPLRAIGPSPRSSRGPSSDRPRRLDPSSASPPRWARAPRSGSVPATGPDRDRPPESPQRDRGNGDAAGRDRTLRRRRRAGWSAPSRATTGLDDDGIVGPLTYEALDRRDATTAEDVNVGDEPDR